MKSIRFIGLCVGLTILALGVLPSTALAQFNSGSDGTNGVFPPVPPGAGITDITLDLRNGEVAYLPDGPTIILQGTPAGGFQDGVLRFTTVEAPAGVTWRFIGNDANSVVSILAQDDVDILGTINLNGENGGNFSTGRGGFGGPGGFKGGNGQILRSSAEAGHGMGPGGGKGGGFGGDGDGIGGGGGGGFGSVGAPGENAVPDNRGGTYGTLTLLPLVGGSGAGGGSGHEFNPALGSGGGGGGGAGAILIASSTRIDISGSIVARGGNGGDGIQDSASSGGGGSGGGVRLMAETLSGAGSINTSGGSGGNAPRRDGGSGGLGRIRLEAVIFNHTGTLTGISNNGGLGVVFIPNLPTVTIVSVGGNAVPADPTGYLGGTDVIIAGPGIATVELATTQVPPDTTISVTAKPETDAVVIGPVVSGGLIGTLENAETSVDLNFPSGGIYFLEAIATFAAPPP